MLPHLTNTAGLWALLGIPLILAIHFLQHRTRVRLTATMFLLESLAPEAATGRNWDRLRSSRALWLQLLAVLLLAWVLAAPCWVRQDAEQTVVFIMDDSANMYPFREEAVQAVAEDMENIGKQGIPTTWVLMGSRPARLPFYRGNNRNAALQSLS
ncbi:MAG: BatA domain-containing protein, partial [Akkermansia sp.]